MPSPNLLTFCLAILLSSTGIANATDAACKYRSEDGGLPETGNDLISAKKIFFQDNEEFPVRVFSDLGSTEINTEICIRNEL